MFLNIWSLFSNIISYNVWKKLQINNAFQKFIIHIHYRNGKL